MDESDRLNRLKELIEWRLDYFKRMPHREIAVAGALDFCAENNVPAPHDLVQEAVTVICSLLQRERSQKKGRANTAIARFRQDMVDSARWSEVYVMLEMRDRMRARLKEYDEVPGCEETHEHYRKWCKWLGNTLDRAFECAAISLSDTFAFGGKDAVKASYLKVEKALKSPTEAMRYGYLDFSTLPKLGLDDTVSHKGNYKGPIYNRTA